MTDLVERLNAGLKLLDSKLHTLTNAADVATALGLRDMLTETRDDESPSFAPNSRLLIYATRSQGRDVLMTTSLDGRIKATLTTSQADVREPVWGPSVAARP